MTTQLFRAVFWLVLALTPSLTGHSPPAAPIANPQTVAAPQRQQARATTQRATPALANASVTPRRAAATPTGPEPSPPEPGHDPARLWQQLETLLDQEDLQQVPIAVALLAESLHRHSQPSVYQAINDMLSRANVPLEIKAILLDLLAETATPEALAELLNLAGQELDNSLYILALQAIARIGDNRWDGRFHEELSPALEAVWANPGTNDPSYLDAIGKGIASIGAPDGVSQLLQTVASGNSGKDTEATRRIKQQVAFQAIPKVRNPAAVEVLTTGLQQEPLGSAASEASGNALSAMGSPAATEKLLDWAKDAPAAGSRNLKDWLSNVNDESSVAMLGTAASQSFKSPEIQSVVDQAAANANPKAGISAASGRP